jgi:hypothetical protein
MVKPEKAAAPNRQTPALIGETITPIKPWAPDALRKMIASGKSVPSKASTK